MRIEDYAVVGDTQTAALIGRTGSVDWLCFPRFDSGACFAALLGTPEHGRWLLAPRGELRAVRRRYQDATLILETEMDSDEGTVRVIDFMPIRGRAPRATQDAWRAWAERASPNGPYRDAVQRSLLTLKALTYAPSGGIVAAATTSLPEELGGARNWDYRYCWLRDATFTLQAFLHAGYRDEARAWREWLVRAVAGEPAKLQILYGVTGERRIDEREIGWLPGYEGSRPVRVGNAAVSQRQLDVYGELMDVLYLARCSGLHAGDDAWSVQRACLDWLEAHWPEPDEGMWEVRGGQRQFTLSKVMAWAAFDRAARTVEQFGLDGPLDRWRALGDHIHAEVCARGFDRDRNTFTQSYDSKALDASLLLLPIVGFLPGDDPRMLGTIEAIRRELAVDGFVRRYHTSSASSAGSAGNIDGLPGSEGVFLACSFWLVDALVLAGRRQEAKALFERLLAVRNDVGLLSEEYDPRQGRLVGNFPQAFSHVALINSARNLSVEVGPAHQRAGNASES